MRLALTLASTALLGGLSAQELLLVERVPSPLAYVAIAPGSEAGVPGPDILLEDPIVRHLLAVDGEAGRDSTEPAASTGSSALGVLDGFRGLLALSTGEIELVLTGLLPRADAPALPLLLSRVRLSDDGATRLQKALADGVLAAPSREVSGVQVYALAADGRSEAANRRAGSRIELALVGRDLLVANNLSNLDAVLEVARAGAPRVEPDSIAADPAFVALRQRLAGGPGSAVVLLDWRRLRDRALQAIGVERDLLLHAAGLRSAERVALGLGARDGALFTTVLIDQPVGVDGLLAVARPTPIRKLAQELPGHGLAAVAFAVEPERLHELAHQNRGGPVGAFHGHLVGGCRSFGVDFDDQIAARLGDTGTCRLVLLDGPDEPGAGVRSAVALSFRARSARAAKSLFDDIKVAVTESRIAAQTTGRGEHEVLVFQPRGEQAFGAVSGASFGVVGDAVVMGLHAAAVDRLAELDRAQSRSERTRALASTQRLLDRLVAARGIDAKSVIGVLEFDGGGLAPAAGSDAATSPNKPSVVGAVRRHAGVILLDTRDGSSSLRVELISSI